MEKEKENGHKKVFAPFIPTIPKEKKKEIIPTNGKTWWKNNSNSGKSDYVKFSSPE